MNLPSSNDSKKMKKTINKHKIIANQVIAWGLSFKKIVDINAAIKGIRLTITSVFATSVFWRERIKNILPPKTNKEFNIPGKPVLYNMQKKSFFQTIAHPINTNRPGTIDR